jgi:hypothetical protein
MLWYQGMIEKDRPGGILVENPGSGTQEKWMT